MPRSVTIVANGMGRPVRLLRSRTMCVIMRDWHIGWTETTMSGSHCSIARRKSGRITLVNLLCDQRSTLDRLVWYVSRHTRGCRPKKRYSGTT